MPPAEAFEFHAIDEADLPAVQALLTALHDHRPSHFDALSRLLGSYPPPWLHDEYITILHRLLARAAGRGTSRWHRDPRRMAAAFVWLALGGNGALGRGRKVPAQDIWRWYDVSDCRTLARRLCVDAQLGSPYSPDDDLEASSDLHVAFGEIQVLHSSFRSHVAQSRDNLMSVIADMDRRRASRRPLRSIGDGQVELRARQARALWAFKAPSKAGRAAVMVAFGQSTDDDDYELIALSVPDARQLVVLLQDALDAPWRG